MTQWLVRLLRLESVQALWSRLKGGQRQQRVNLMRQIKLFSHTHFITHTMHTHTHIHTHTHTLASWQLIAVVKGLKTTQSDKKYDVKLPKPTQNQSKNSLKTTSLIFLVAVVIYTYPVHKV